MEYSRSHNTIRNTCWGLINKITVLIIPFITRTVLIKVLGMEYVGLSGLFTSVLSILNLAELGVSSAIVFSLYKPIASQDTDAICALMLFYKKVYRIIGSVVFAFGIMMLPFLKYMIKGEVSPEINIYILYIIYLSNTSVSYFMFAYKNCLFIAHQRTDVGLKIQTVCALAQNTVQICLIVICRSYYIYAMVIPLFTVCSNVITASLAKKNYPDYVCRGKINDEVLSDLKKQIGGLMIGKISGTVRSAIDSLFISSFLGLQSVAMYSNYFYIVTAAAGMIQLIDSAMLAGVGNSIATESVKKNYGDFKMFTFMLQWIVGIISICILCLIQPFITIWLGREMLYENVMAFLCASYLYFYCIGLIRGIYTQATGMWWDLRLLSIIDIFVNLFLNIVFVCLWGVYGVIFASILDLVIVSIPYTTCLLFKGYFCKERVWNYFYSLICYACVTGIAGFFTYFICEIVPNANPFANILIRGAVCFLVPNILYFIIYYKNSLYKECVKFIKLRLKRRRRYRQ